jgi:hypothetical protein
VVAIIKLIDPSLPTNIKFVRQYRARKVIYDVEMYFASDSQSIRDAYGLFFRRRSGRRLPDGLKGLTVSNVTTFSTRVRVRLLKEVCQRHQAANPTLSCFVTGYLPRPELKICDRKGPLLSYSYTKTVKKLSHHLSLEFLQELYKFARTNLPEEEVAERFLILTSDLLCTTSPDLLSMSIDEESPPEAVSSGQESTPAPQIVSTAQTTPQLILTQAPSFLASSSAAQTVTSFQVAPAAPTGTPPALVQVPNISTPSAASVLPLANVVSSPQDLFTSPGQASQFPTVSSVLPPPPNPIASSQTPDNEFVSLTKRNRNRFAPKSAPYPAR